VERKHNIDQKHVQPRAKDLEEEEKNVLFGRGQTEGAELLRDGKGLVVETESSRESLRVRQLLVEYLDRGEEQLVISGV